MIVKILKPSATFKGVSYNTSKMENDKGELMKVSGFGALQAIEHLRPKDYINYLEARSARNSRIKLPQFHAVISCKGKSHTKEQLTELATEWLKGMGYGNQPYLLVFHKDTSNNHIHIVSTRIDENGRKINDSYEKIRAYEVLNRLTGLNEKSKIDKDLATALKYSFSTHAQFMMLLENQGYSLKLENKGYNIFKYGRQQGSINQSTIDEKIKGYKKDISRLAQIRAIIEKYRKNYNPELKEQTQTTSTGTSSSKLFGYSSELTEMLASKFGVQFLFHGKPGLPPYGYTVIDHLQKTVYKGKELMALDKLVEVSDNKNNTDLKHQHEDLIFDTQILEVDTISQPTFQTEEQTSNSQEQAGLTFFPELNLDLADDIDDEAILGRNRQRKRKARTNTR